MSATCWQNYLQDYLYSKSLTLITASVLPEPLFWFWELVSHNCLTVARGRALLNNLRMCTQSFSFKNLGLLLFSCSPTQEPAETKFHAATRHQGGGDTVIPQKIKIYRALCCSRGQLKLGGHLQSPAMGRQDVPFNPRPWAQVAGQSQAVGVVQVCVGEVSVAVCFE